MRKRVNGRFRKRALQRHKYDVFQELPAADQMRRGTGTVMGMAATVSSKSAELLEEIAW
jgi:hypothetical protein